MKNFLQPGLSVTVTAAAAIASGDFVKVGALCGVAQGAAAIGEDVAIVRCGVFTLPKLSAQAWTVGQKIYWSTADSECTTVVGSNTLIGVAHAVAADSSDTGDVLLDGAAR